MKHVATNTDESACLAAQQGVPGQVYAEDYDDDKVKFYTGLPSYEILIKSFNLYCSSRNWAILPCSLEQVSRIYYGPYEITAKRTSPGSRLSVWCISIGCFKSLQFMVQGNGYSLVSFDSVA